MRPTAPITLCAFICLTALLLCISVTPLSTRARARFLSSLLPPSVAARASTTLPFETFSVAQASANRPRDAQFARRLRAFLRIIVTQYADWHRHQRLLCDADGAHARSLRLLVLRSNGNAGVGDRMRSILYSYLAAVASDRLFLIDWQSPLPLAAVLPSARAHNFTYDATLFTDAGRGGDDEEHVVYGPSDYEDLRVYLSSRRVVVNQKYNKFSFHRFFSLYERYPELNLSRRIVQAGLQHFRITREEVAPFILNALFQTSPSLRRSLRKLLPFGGQRYVSLHARLGHGVGEKSGRFNFEQRGVTLEDMSTCIGSLAATMARQRGCERVFVVTDTKRARPFLEAGIHAVLPHADVAHSPINATHFFALHGPEYFPDESDRRHRFEEVFVDLGLLAMAESMVFFESGYGVLAAWLGAITDSVMMEFDNCTQLQRGNVNATTLLPQRLLSDVF